MKTKVGGSAILIGIRRRGQGRLRKSGVWKAWGTPEMKGGNTRRRCPGQSLSPAHCDPFITARTSDPGTPATACQICALLPTETLRPTHRLHSQGAPQPAPSRPPAHHQHPGRSCCHPLPQQPLSTPQPSKPQRDWRRQASIATARPGYLVEMNLVFRNSSDTLSP